jgi:hypothetical protein
MGDFVRVTDFERFRILTFEFAVAGPEGLRALTNPKAIISDRLPWLIQTSIPRVVDYPIPSLVQSW